MNPAGAAAAASAGTTGRATRAFVDLDAYAGNVRVARSLLSPATELMAVVKANGYGHGATMVAREALAAGATRLGVATVAEGTRLRGEGIDAPIVLLGPIDPTEARSALEMALELTVASEALLDAVAEAARSLPLTGAAGVHVKADTGMRRYGATPDEAVGLARRVAADPTLSLVGFSTHFAAADDADDRFTREQAERFERCLERLAEVGARPRYAHAANSAAALRSRRHDYDLVRAGIALYGLRPAPSVALAAGMKPVLSLRSRIARVIEVGPGETVGYGRTYRAERAERAALVPIGYGDGYRRGLSGKGWMGIGGRRAPVLGRVSMDQTVVALPDGVGAEIGDEVEILGDPAAGAPTADDLAGVLGTITYEVTTALSARVDRHFLRGGVPVAIEGMP